MIDLQASEPTNNQSIPEEKSIKLTPRQSAYLLLRNQGLTQQQAADGVGIARTYGSLIEKKVDKKYSLGEEKLVSKAHKAIKNLIQGQPFGTIEKVKDSTALMAAQMVYDRYQPVVKQSVNLNLNADISPVDLSKYQGD